MPGYGWIFPVGDGTVNIGVGLLSTFRDFKSVNTTHLLDAYARQIADRWEIDPDQPECRPTSGRIPMGGSVGPKAGPTYLVVGDAAGSVNPFNGEGIDYAYETARMAADVIHEALSEGDASALQRYPKLLDDEYGQYFKVGPAVRQGDRPPGADARTDPCRDAQPHADGVGAAHHGQPAAPRRARPGRGGLQGGRGDRPPRPRRLTASMCRPNDRLVIQLTQIGGGATGELPKHVRPWRSPRRAGAPRRRGDAPARPARRRPRPLPATTTTEPTEKIAVGMSVEGRPITAMRHGDPTVVGCWSSVSSTATNRPDCRSSPCSTPLPVPPGVDLYLVESMNPDGVANNTRGNANGVDLNRNFPYNWGPIGAPGDGQYAGPEAASEPETQAVVDLITALHPDLVIWYHQDLFTIAPGQGRDGAIRARYAELTGLPMETITGGTYTGVAAQWARDELASNEPQPGVAFIVELGPTLSAEEAQIHAEAVLTIAERTTDREISSRVASAATEHHAPP